MLGSQRAGPKLCLPATVSAPFLSSSPALSTGKDGGNFAHSQAKSLSKGGRRAGSWHNPRPLSQQHGGSQSPAKVPARGRCPAGDVWSLLRSLSKTLSIPAGLRKPLLAHVTGSVSCSRRTGIRCGGMGSAVVGGSGGQQGVSPGVDEVLRKADVCRGSCDGDLALR